MTNVRAHPRRGTRGVRRYRRMPFTVLMASPRDREEDPDMYMFVRVDRPNTLTISKIHHDEPEETVALLGHESLHATLMQHKNTRDEKKMSLMLDDYRTMGSDNSRPTDLIERGGLFRPPEWVENRIKRGLTPMPRAVRRGGSGPLVMR